MGDAALKKTSSVLSPRSKAKGKGKGKKVKKAKVEKEPESVTKKVVKRKGWTVTRDLIVQGKVGVSLINFLLRWERPSPHVSPLHLDTGGSDHDQSAE